VGHSAVASATSARVVRTERVSDKEGDKGGMILVV